MSHSPASRLWQARCTATSDVEHEVCTVMLGPVSPNLYETSGRKIVLVVAEDGRQTGLGSQEVPVHRQIVQQVGVHAGAGIDPDGSPVVARAISRRLQGLPGAFQEQTVLRVGDLRVPRRETEEARVEEIGVVQHSPGLDVARIVQRGRGNAGRLELGIGEVRDGLDALTHILPERLEAAGARKTASHSHDGDLEATERIR